MNFQNGYHTEKLVLDYNLDDNQYILDLILNKELIPKNAFIEHQKDGRAITTEITEKVKQKNESFNIEIELPTQKFSGS